jgi:hypothetical protein
MVCIDGRTAPDNYSSPDWTEDRRVHNWRNHVPEHVRVIWPSFSDEQKQHLAIWADELASAEEWE